MKKVEGYAVLFDDWSLIAGSFWERVRPGAFTKTLRDGHEIFLVHHHDFRTTLATTGNGTLKLKEDRKGLHFSAELPDITSARDLGKLIKIRTVSGMSFGFYVNGAAGEDWRERKNGDPERDLLDLKLQEITITPIPAYKSTSVAVSGRKSSSSTDPRPNVAMAAKQRMKMKLKLKGLQAR